MLGSLSSSQSPSCPPLGAAAGRVTLGAEEVAAAVAEFILAGDGTGLETAFGVFVPPVIHEYDFPFLPIRLPRAPRAVSFADLCCRASVNFDSASFLSFFVVFFSASRGDILAVSRAPGVETEPDRTASGLARVFLRARFARRASS